MPMIFTGQKISLRKVTLADCNDKYVAWLNDADVSRYLETRFQPQTRETVESFVLRVANSHDSHLLAIIENFTSQHIGNIKIGPVNPHHLCADISYFIGAKAYWGNGFATEAVQGALTYAFDTLGLFSVRAGLYASNLASRAVLEKCGFVQCGVFPAELVGERGREDHIYLSITRPQWEAACST